VHLLCIAEVVFGCLQSSKAASRRAGNPCKRCLSRPERSLVVFGVPWFDPRCAHPERLLRPSWLSDAVRCAGNVANARRMRPAPPQGIGTVCQKATLSLEYGPALVAARLRCKQDRNRGERDCECCDEDDHASRRPRLVGSRIVESPYVIVTPSTTRSGRFPARRRARGVHPPRGP